MRKIGTILPNSNELEFADIRKQLKRRGVTWYERKLSGMTIFWFQESELKKLPSHPPSQGNSKFTEYLPVDEESGHGISPLDQFLIVHPGEDTLHA